MAVLPRILCLCHVRTCTYKRCCSRARRLVGFRRCAFVDALPAKRDPSLVQPTTRGTKPQVTPDDAGHFRLAIRAKDRYLSTKADEL